VPARLGLTAAFAALVGAALVGWGCGNPPQVVDISPARGATEVRSSEPIRIRFDRAMDQASVAERFRLVPGVQGTLHWASDRELAYEHPPLAASSRYQAVLEPGYRDAGGSVNSLRHSWFFRTEAPPSLAGSAPGAGDRGVDPAAYITLTFSREMDPAALRGAISLSPSVPFAIRPDAADAHKVVLAPSSILEPNVDYSVAVTRDAHDVDGNPLGAGGLVTFTTGDLRPLKHWVGFVAQPTDGTAGDGVWIVDENRFPRRLVAGPADGFSWSSDGRRLLLRTPAGTWSDQALDAAATTLPFRGDWADYLDTGYAFLDGARLQILEPDGQVVTVADGVSDAAVAPGGSRIAFVVATPLGGSEIDAYATDLRSRYRLQSEAGTIDGLTWSQDGLALAYRVDPGDPLRSLVRARVLRDGQAVTVAVGQVSTPSWQADGRHLFFTAVVPTPSGPTAKAFRLTVGDPPPKTLTAGAGMPATPGLQVTSLSPSPDGHQLAFAAETAGRAAVFLMNADGTGLTQLTEFDHDSFPYAASAVAWTPT
jgi:Bacterial Ig-like domain